MDTLAWILFVAAILLLWGTAAFLIAPRVGRLLKRTADSYPQFVADHHRSTISEDVAQRRERVERALKRHGTAS